MIYLLGAIVWPLGFVGLYFAHPLILPNEPPLDTAILFVVGLLGMAAFTFAGALRMLGFLRDDRVKKEKSRAEAANDTEL